MRLFAGLTSALLCALFAGAGFASADPAVTISNDGTYTVGKDITPGVYESAGPLPGAVCYWRRAGADNATLNNAMSKQPQIVQIEATDATFKTKGWSAVAADRRAPARPDSALAVGASAAARLRRPQRPGRQSGNGQPPAGLSHLPVRLGAGQP